MNNTSLKLRKKAPNHIIEILRLVFNTTSELNIPAFVVGATARDLIFEYVYEADILRATEDIDFGIAVGNWTDYEKIKKSLIDTKKFRDDGKNEQRIWWIGEKESMKIDLVPYGGLESPQGKIAFPPDGGFQMSTMGFAEAFENSILLEMTEDFTVNVVSLPGLALLKFIAYNDRPHERRRDIQDIWFIAKNYMKVEAEERLFDENASDGDLLLDETFEYETCGARLLGRDIARLLNEDTRTILTRIMAEEKDGGRLEAFADVIQSDGLYDDDRYKNILKTLRELRRGITERSA